MPSLESICGEQELERSFRGCVAEARESRQAWGGGRWGARQFYSDSVMKDLRLLQNHLIASLFPPPFCIVWMFFLEHVLL